MKTSGLNFLVLLLALFTTANVWGEAPASKATEAKLITKSSDDFKKHVCSSAWTWARPGDKPQVIHFAPNGNVTNNHWVARYSIRNLNEITFRKDGKVARLKFSATYDSFTGLDFNEATPVSGKQTK